MTQIAAQAQIRAIERAHEKSTQSKESALKFLKAAGIIQDSSASTKNNKPSKKPR